MTTEADINQEYDRVTNMLRESMQPMDYRIGALANLTNPAGFLQTVQQDKGRQMQTSKDILGLFEAKKARGDKQAQMLEDKINLFTGGDPEGNALILQSLHDDPESIDPGNSYQVMTKIAGIVKKSGYVSPAQQEQKLNMQLKKAQLANAQKGPEKPANQKELEYYQSLSPEQQAIYDKLNKIGTAGTPVKPMPATAVKAQNEAIADIGTAAGINARLQKTIQQLNDETLKLGPLDNLASRARNWAGESNQTSRNFASFKSNLEKMRNDSLRLNKGVQTEGDAQRAWNEITENLNDEKLVKQRLTEIMGYNQQAAELKKLEVDSLRSNFEQDPYDYSKIENVFQGQQDEDLFNYMTPEEKALFGK